MNAGASNVEDKNIHPNHKTFVQCLALNLLENGSTSFRNRSFTLFRNERDFRERFDFAAVSESISSSSMTKTCLCAGGTNLLVAHMHGSHRSCFHHFIRFPLLRRPLVVIVPFWVVWWASAHRKPRSWLLLIPQAQRYFLTFRFGFPRAFRCSRGLWFCCYSFFTCIFLCSFRHRFETVNGTEMADVEHTHKRWSVHHVWGVPWAVCLRVGFWCQCT